MTNKPKAINKRRIAPPGYIAVNKNLAEHLYNKGRNITLCGNNVSSYHVFSGWCLGYTVNSCDGKVKFQNHVNDFLSYLDKELGTYAVFYVKESDVKEDM